MYIYCKTSPFISQLKLKGTLKFVVEHGEQDRKLWIFLSLNCLKQMRIEYSKNKGNFSRNLWSQNEVQDSGLLGLRDILWTTTHYEKNLREP